MTDDKVDPSKEESEAIGRLGFTDDGRILHRYLRRELERLGLTADQSTLLVLHGRRSLAHDLMRLMADGIEARRGGSSTDDPILTRSSGAVAGARPRGARRRVADSDPFADPDTDPSGGSGAS